MSKRRKSSAEFKHGAVEQARQPGVSCVQVARELGIRDSLLTRWKREAQSRGPMVFAGTGTPRDEDLAHLKRELARVKSGRESNSWPLECTLPLCSYSRRWPKHCLCGPALRACSYASPAARG